MSTAALFPPEIEAYRSQIDSHLDRYSRFEQGNLVKVAIARRAFAKRFAIRCSHPENESGRCWF